ncbi:hypothetical protein BD779DRAFT_1672972 [Infundibulicybe gibba]|nr:hypothetical protein BD779DRAFT_1672972 [Infundibulicybe gibba]
MSTNTPSTKSGWGYRIGAAVQHVFSVLTSRPSTSFIGSLEQTNASLGSTQDLLPPRLPTLLAPSTIMKPPTREAASMEDLCPVEPTHRPPSSSASQIPAAPSPRLTATLIHEATFEKGYPRVQHTLSPGIFTGLTQHVATMDPPADYSPLLNTARRSTIFNLIAESSTREVASTGDHSPINPSLAECGLPLVMGSPADGPGEFTEELEELPQHVVSPASRSPSPPTAPHPRYSVQPWSPSNAGRDRNDLRGAVREASRDSAREAAREFASTLAQDTRPPTPADGHASPILGSSAADKPLKALTGKRDNLPQLAIIIDPTHLSPPISEPGPSANAPNTPQAELNPRRWIEPVSTPPKPRLDPRIWRDRRSLPQTPERNAKEKEAIIPSDRDAGGRSRTSSIHLPHDDPFTDPISPATDLSRRDELSPYIFGLYKQVGETGPGGDDNVITPISANVGHPRSIQDASARSIATGSPTRYGFDTSETRPSLTPENVSYNPDYTTGPPSEQFMVLGVRHSTLSSGRGPSRRRTLSPQGPEQDKVGGDGQTRKWTVPISRDSCLSDARWQQNPGGPPDEAYGVIPDFEAQ